MKESDSVQALLNEYESINSQILAQGMTIDDELKALLLMSSLPMSWETFVTVGIKGRLLPLCIFSVNTSLS